MDQVSLWVAANALRVVVTFRRTYQCFSNGLMGVCFLLIAVQQSTNAAQSVTLAWNANSETNLAGYRLYYGTSSRQYTQSNQVPVFLTTSTVSDLAEGLTYYFAVTAVATDGLESPPSEEVSYTVPRITPILLPSLTESLVVAPPPSSAPFVPVETEEVVSLDGDEWLIAPDVITDSSRPKLEIFTVGQPIVAFRVQFDTPTNRWCELQVSEDFNSWSQLLAFPTGPSAERLEYYDPAGGAGSRRFYRIVAR